MNRHCDDIPILGATEKRLAIALAASIAAHAAAWSLVPPIQTQIAPLTRTLAVLLVAQPEAPPPAVEPAPQPPPARPAPAAAKPRPAERVPQPPAPQESVAASHDPAPIVPQQSAAPQSDPAPAILARAPGPAQAPTAVAAPSPELLAGYGTSVSRLLARHREYPRIALMRGWEGTVTMRLNVAPGGKLVEARIEGSSGHAVLDAQALDMTKRVTELPTPPEGLRDREFAVLVPVVFRLER